MKAFLEKILVQPNNTLINVLKKLDSGQRNSFGS